MNGGGEKSGLPPTHRDTTPIPPPPPPRPPGCVVDLQVMAFFSFIPLSLKKRLDVRGWRGVGVWRVGGTAIAFDIKHHTVDPSKRSLSGAAS